jgi:hypothetical protein
MAVLTETGLWEAGVCQLEVEDGPQVGADGIDNVPLRRYLADRAKFLNDARLSGYIAGKGHDFLTALGGDNYSPGDGRFAGTLQRRRDARFLETPDRRLP